MIRFTNVLLSTLVVICLGAASPDIASAQAPNLTITNSSVPANGTMSISWYFSEPISGIDYYITGPSAAGSAASPGQFSTSAQVGSINTTPQELTGNSNTAPGTYRLYARASGGSMSDYRDVPFTVTSSGGTPIAPTTPTPTTPTPTNPGTPTTIGNYKSDKSLAYTIAILQYVQKLMVYERNPVGPMPVPPPVQQF